jgi:hypothetical protein
MNDIKAIRDNEQHRLAEWLDDEEEAVPDWYKESSDEEKAEARLDKKSTKEKEL